ncbi:response regulator transcription factor [Paenibacillus pinihumi]|uniref:response regulator transcription factor n=1 Tax=Paenibacillus pinihumi TaxID=669462 RepID=UPI0004004A26|nr:response regulator transcription factor [Paenibacillus pinihumi]
MAKILVVDDDEDIRELIRIYLAGEGYSVTEASDGVEAMEIISNVQADLVILDIMMPHMDGWELCERLRQDYPEMPMLMLSAKGETQDKLRGFRLGTDDYMVKPFDPLELVMRVKALLKRYRIQASMKVQLGQVVLDKQRYEVEWNGRMITLPLKEFDLLFKLGSAPGKIFTRNQLIDQIWGADFDGNDRTVDVHIKRIRERFPDEEAPFIIVTKRGLGYKLEMKP